MKLFRGWVRGQGRAEAGGKRDQQVESLTPSSPGPSRLGTPPFLGMMNTANTAEKTELENLYLLQLPRNSSFPTVFPLRPFLSLAFVPFSPILSS